MNVWGKVFAFLAVIGAVAGVAFSARMLEVRNSWSKRAMDLQADIQKNAEQIDEKAAQLKGLEAEYDRTMLTGWNEYWNGPVVTVQPDGTVTSELGSNYRVAEGQVLYLFQPVANGAESLYVGPFKITTLRENQSVLTPDWRVQPGDPATWASGQPWRIWANIPNAHKSRFVDLEVDLVNANELLAAKQFNITVQDELIAKAKEHRDLRIGELLGSADNAGLRGKVDARFVDGLVAAIEQEEEERNTVLADVDGLRRLIKMNYDNYVKLRDENVDLAGRLVEADSKVTSR